MPIAQTPLLGTSASALTADLGYLTRVEHAMEIAASVSGHREKAETARRRIQVMQEYQSWLLTIPVARRPSLLTSTGYDVLQFLIEDWGIRHAGRTMLPSGISQATPGYLAGAVASLATGFREQGISNAANPALQLPVRFTVATHAVLVYVFL